ncbi:hypothetical protein QBC34DRAFT_499619 [Podospora aff. communis PSN243]|uniref:F-box domain-containing protein n=1 Tax=Podospora aff. communis PSN243 TaxID=3040156 RepID=A0AAV9G3I7_9PEZI|nr:hypothetical protein QBC34DRAFT_499619 [Podospora aff. communis PSN243]
MPAELVDEILANCIASSTSWHPGMLCKISLVCRRWRALLRDEAYSSWEHNGQFDSIRSLWNFLRIILGDQQIAATVRTLGDQDIEMLRGAVNKVGLQGVEAEFLAAFRKADPRAFVALLLANIPNLTTLHAQLPQEDPFLCALLQKVGCGSTDKDGWPAAGRPFQHLLEANLAGHMNYYLFEGHNHFLNPYTQDVRHLLPILQSPKLQKLALFDLGSCGAPPVPCSGNLDPKSSSVTDLTLVHTLSGHRCQGPAAPGPLPVLAAAKALTSLSFSAENLGSGPRPDDAEALTRFKLWRALCQHKASLQRLDIFTRATELPFFMPEDDLPHTAYSAPFGSMRAFKCLEHISMQPDTLVGLRPDGSSAHITLKDTLPRSLKSLTVYRSYSMFPDETLVSQLLDVIRSPDFPLLKRLAVEDDPYCFVGNARVGYAVFPHDDLEYECEKVGMTYEAKKSYDLANGGSAAEYYADTQDDCATWQDEWDRTNDSLTARLSRLREQQPLSRRKKDVFGRAVLRLDDIDTYDYKPRKPSDRVVAASLRKEWKEFRAMGIAEGLRMDSFENMGGFMGIGN